MKNGVKSIQAAAYNGARTVYGLSYSVPTDRRSFRTGPKKILEDWSVQDLKIAKRTSKDLFFDSGTIIRFFKIVSLKF